MTLSPSPCSPLPQLRVGRRTHTRLAGGGRTRTAYYTVEHEDRHEDTVGFGPSCVALYPRGSGSLTPSCPPSGPSACPVGIWTRTWLTTVPSLPSGRTRSTRETATLCDSAPLSADTQWRTAAILGDMGGSVRWPAMGRVRWAGSLYMQCARMPLLAACPHPACRPHLPPPPP